jgi:superoxide reductase
MAERMEIYRCNVCGNIVFVLQGGKGELVCCGKPMELLKAGATDAAQEKHVPVVEAKEGGYEVKVGSVTHPMEEKHYIVWIELLGEEEAHIKFLKPGDEPKAFFKGIEKPLKAREYCNLHGLWEKEIA